MPSPVIGRGRRHWRGCSQGGSGQQEHIREIIEREHDADEIIREVLQTVRKTFLTPFDRGAITALIGSMDDAIDEMQAAASAIDLYEVHANSARK